MADVGVKCKCPKDANGVQTHPANCPTLAWLQELRRELAPKLAEMDRVRRRGAAKARNYVIG